MEPYRLLAEKLKLSENELLSHIDSLLHRGFLTRVGPFFNMDRTSGHVSLVAMKVPPERFEEVSQVINSLEEVAHNYERNHEFNMWFVVSGFGKKAVENTLSEIERLTGLKTYNFPKLKEYALDLYLEA